MSALSPQPPREGEPHRLSRRISRACGVVYTIQGTDWALSVSRRGVRLRETVPAGVLWTVAGVLPKTQDELGSLATPREGAVFHRIPESGLAVTLVRLRLVGLRVDAYRLAYPSEGEGWVQMTNHTDYLGPRKHPTTTKDSP